MTLKEIRELPTRVDLLPSGIDRARASEDNFRGKQMLIKAKEYLDQGAPPLMVLEIIDDIMGE